MTVIIGELKYLTSALCRSVILETIYGYKLREKRRRERPGSSEPEHRALVGMISGRRQAIASFASTQSSNAFRTSSADVRCSLSYNE